MPHLSPEHKVQSDLFEEVLDILADLDIILSPPDVFVVYAHDNEGLRPKANADCIVQLLRWLERIRAPVQSDKNTLFRTREVGEAAVHNIVSNQLTLLPRQHVNETGQSRSVHKVLLCGSELLSHYCDSEYAKGYIEDIVNIYENHIQSAQNQDEAIGRYIEQHHMDIDFHNVLTEIAFLRIRQKFRGRAETGVIPIALNGGHRSLLPSQMLYEELNVHKVLESTTEPENLRELFFWMIRLLYPESESVIRGLQHDCYRVVVQDLTTSDPNAETSKVWRSKMLMEVEKLLRRESDNHIYQIRASNRLHELKQRISKDEAVRARLKEWSLPEQMLRSNPEQRELIEQTWKKGGFHVPFHTKVVKLKGVKGVGKTTTMAGLIHKMREQARDQQRSSTTSPPFLGTNSTIPALQAKTQIVAYVFIEFEQDTTVNKTLMSVVRQIVESIPDSVEKIHKLMEQIREVGLDTKSLTHAILDLVGEDYTLCIFLDGLDEAVEEHRSGILTEVRELLRSSNISAVLSFRDGTRFESFRKLPNELTLILHSQEKDITQFLRRALEKVYDSSPTQYEWAVDPVLRNRIISSIRETSADNFLLAELNWMYIRPSHGKEDVEECLRNLAPGIQHQIQNPGDLASQTEYVDNCLSAAFERNFTHRILKIPGMRDRDRALSIFVYLRDTLRPLHLTELQELLRCNLGNATTPRRSVTKWPFIKNYCQGLVISQTPEASNNSDDDHLVVFFHHSLRQYLNSKAGHSLIPTRKKELALTCVQYLLFDCCKHDKEKDHVSCLDSGPSANLTDLRVKLKAWPLLDYAARNWHKHLRIYEQSLTESREGGDQADGLHWAALRFLQNKNRVEAVFQIYEIPAETLRAQAVVSKMVQIAFIAHTTSEGEVPERDLFSPNQMTGLHLACLLNLERLAQQLIDELPRENYSQLSAANFEKRHPLHFAIQVGATGIVQHLLKETYNGFVDPQAQDFRGATPLFEAAESDNQAIVELLLAKGRAIDINTQTYKVQRRQTRFIQWEPNGSKILPFVLYSIGGRTALHCAAVQENTVVLRRLLEDPTIQVDLQDTEGQTALHKAAKKGRIEAVKLLTAHTPSLLAQRVGYGLDGEKCIRPPDELRACGRTALYLASAYQHADQDKVLEFFLEHHPSMCNVKDHEGDAALHRAIGAQASRNVAILLKCASIDSNLSDRLGRSPLMLAALLDSDDILFQLLNHAGLDSFARKATLAALKKLAEELYQ